MHRTGARTGRRDVYGERSSWFCHRIRQPLQRYLVRIVLARRQLPPSKDGRRIPLRILHDPPLIDERTGHGYLSNKIRSSRYTPWDFLPRQFFFQATRTHNLYFLCIGILQAIPGFSTTGKYTTILPVMFFLLITIAKEGYDDYRRSRLDRRENNQVTTVLRRTVNVDETSTSKQAIDYKPATCPAVLNGPATITKSAIAEIVNEKEDDACPRVEWKETKWESMQVGEVVKIRRDEHIPADVVLLHASGENGVAYIETTALDGETSLKSKQVLPELLCACGEIDDIDRCDAHFVLEEPNQELYEFSGKVAIDGKTLPLTLNEVVFRGSVLRNTEQVIGLVVNTGEECKSRMNANHHPQAKKPRLEKYATLIVLILIFYVIVLSVGLSVGYLNWHADFATHAWYLKGARVPFQHILIGFLITFNNVIPLSLYVSLEIVKVGQMLLMQSDVEMFDEESNTPMTCNTNTILEDLGQVEYVLSDKTGTLTENVMRFRGMSVGGIVWEHGGVAQERSQASVDVRLSDCRKESHDSEAGLLADKRKDVIVRECETVSITNQSADEKDFCPAGLARFPAAQRTTAELLNILHQDPTSTMAGQARRFILGLALCHTALPEGKNGVVHFQASSPDEVALVRTAQELGHLLTRRSSQQIELLVSAANGPEQSHVYQVLEVIEFNSKRKRMSVVVRCPDGRIWLICKGADSTIIPRLRHSGSTSAKPAHEEIDADISLYDQCFQHVDRFATEGLRTLLFAHRYLDPEEYESWSKTFRAANTSLAHRQDQIDAAAETIERNLYLLGASAIEDRLQKDVPETIDRLRRAGMRIWMLTGDKRETAINIAHSARICQPSSLVHVLDSTKGDLHGQMNVFARDHDAHRVVVIDGHSLSIVSGTPDLKHLFFSLVIIKADSVIVCRASPAQKAEIVQNIRKKVRGLTLAIGDGANDMAMIQAAHVGIGISGKEGLQAARVADFSIAQFRFLQRLLLVHGRYQYVRTAKFVLVTFWKEMFFYMMQALYQRYNGYTGTSLYESSSLTVLNTLFTSLCVIVPGIFEQDLRPETLLAVPELYVFGARNHGLNLMKYLGSTLNATAAGIAVWFIAWAGYGPRHIMGDNGLFALGDLVFSLGIVWTNCKLLLLETHLKTAPVLVALAITVAGWWAWNGFLSAAYTQNLSPYDVRAGFAAGFGADPAWWLTLILALVALASAELAYAAFKYALLAARVCPSEVVRTDVSLWQELERDPAVRVQLGRMVRGEEAKRKHEA